MAEHDGVEGLGIAADLEELRRLQPPAEDPARRERNLHHVLALAAAQPAARVRPQAWIAGVALPLVAAAGLLFVWSPGARDRARSRTLETAAERAELELADASVVSAGPRTKLVYSAGREDRIRLQRGQIWLRINSRKHGTPLVVETDELAVWVVGTRFAVSRSTAQAGFRTTVVVDEGVVRIVEKPSGRSRPLAAGARLTLPAAGAVEPRAQAHAPSPPAAAANAEPTRQRATPKPTRPEISSEIRQKLREGAVSSARRLIARAQRERAVGAAELAILQAEADLAERRPERARSRYLAIVARYPGTSEAELSLFAAAQLSRGRAGVDLLQRYLARYPDGRFAQEASRLLATLDAHASAH